MEIFVIAVLIGLIPASIAAGKGRSFILWWIYGSALFIVALPHALMMRPDQPALDQQALAAGDKRQCPFCAEIIRAEAKVCRFCGRDVGEAAAPETPPVTGFEADMAMRRRKLAGG